MILLSDKESWKRVPKCEPRHLFKPIIGAGGFVLEDVGVNSEMNEINPAIRPTRQEQRRCGICQRVYQEMETASPSRFDFVKIS